MPEYVLTPDPDDILDREHDQPKQGATIRVRALRKPTTPPATREELDAMRSTFVVARLRAFHYDSDLTRVRSFARVAPSPELEALAYPSKEGEVEIGEWGIHKQDLMVMKAWCIRHQTFRLVVPT